MNVWIYSIPSVILVSLISLVGVFTLALSQDKLKKMTFILVSFAVGALLGDTFIHLIPETFEKLGANLLSSSLFWRSLSAGDIAIFPLPQNMSILLS